MGISVQIKLDNANNNFLGLSNTKFIEARVYDDSDEAIKTEDVPDNKLQLSEEDIIVEAFKQGLEFVNSDFEKVPIENSDSESDTEEGKPFTFCSPSTSIIFGPSRPSSGRASGLMMTGLARPTRSKA